jgi:hypothetical protein
MKYTMSKKDALDCAIIVKDKWEQIVTDAFRMGYLSEDICAGCGKIGCEGCPAGTKTGWNPNLSIRNKK